MTAPTCAFCTLPQARIVTGNQHAVVIRDGFPISPGHTLIIPKRHIGSFFDLEKEEQTAILELLHSAKHQLDTELAPQAYNIGVNDGQAAGQTVLHLHVHLIPRYTGDKPDPRGGVRWIIPEKADYWTQR